MKGSNTVKFRERFESPYQQYRHRIGDRFRVIREVDDKEEGKDPEVGKLYLIEFDDGEQVYAWPEEVEENAEEQIP